MSGTEGAGESHSPQRLLVGTDLSSRVDRALLAAASGAELLLVHAVDDDQPRSLVEIERREAIALLRDQVAWLPELRGLPTTPLIEEGDPVEAVLRIADARDADLVILGEHRRRPLWDVFAGTTVERVMRYGHRPVLMVNRPVGGPYRHVFAATDLPEHSTRALQAAMRLRVLNEAALTIVHAFEPPRLRALALADAPPATVAAHEAKAARRASSGLASFVAALGLPRQPEQRVLAGRPAQASCDVPCRAALQPRSLPPCGTTPWRSHQRLLRKASR